MTLKIGMEGDQWNEILSSLHTVASGTEDIAQDLNVKVTSDGEVQIYIRNFYNLQALHRLENSSDIDIDTSGQSEIVFNSKILRSIIQQAKGRYTTLEFQEHEFTVTVGEQSFATPTTLDLRLVNESEFQKPMSIDGAKEVAKLERQNLLENLQMFETVSKVIKIEIGTDMMEISVSDKVQGSGRVCAYIGDESELEPTKAKFKIRPLKDFLTQVKSETVSILMTDENVLKMEGSSDGKVSEISIAPRQDAI